MRKQRSARVETLVAVKRDSKESPCEKCPDALYCDERELFESCEKLAAWNSEEESIGSESDKILVDSNKICSVEGCNELVRAKGLCVKHYNKKFVTEKFHVTFPQGSNFYKQIQKIAEYEFRTANSQVLYFIARGIEQWAESNPKVRKILSANAGGSKK